MVATTAAAGVALQMPVCELVSQIAAISGSDESVSRTRPVSWAAAPTLVVATANTPVPVGPPVRAKPSPDGVTPTAIMSATGVSAKVSRSVFTPVMEAAAGTPSQSYPSSTLVGGT